MPTARVISLKGGRGKVTLVISCAAGGAACTTADLSVTVLEHLKGGRLKAVTAKSKTSLKTIVIAAGSVSLAAGAHKTLSFALDAKGRALLARFGALSALAKVRSGSAVISHATIHVTRPLKKNKKK